MFQRTLVLFENEKVCPKAVHYARELALRMDAEVSFLMLVEMAFANGAVLGGKRNTLSGIEKRVGRILSASSGEFLREGIAVSIALRVGDPASELVKFLAERPSFQAVIWGSDEDLPDAGPLRRGHWLKKVAGVFECPLLGVSSRTHDAAHCAGSER